MWRQRQLQLTALQVHANAVWVIIPLTYGRLREENKYFKNILRFPVMCCRQYRCYIRVNEHWAYLVYYSSLYIIIKIYGVRSGPGEVELVCMYLDARLLRCHLRHVYDRLV